MDKARMICHEGNDRKLVSKIIRMDNDELDKLIDSLRQEEKKFWEKNKKKQKLPVEEYSADIAKGSKWLAYFNDNNSPLKILDSLKVGGSDRFTSNEISKTTDIEALLVETEEYVFLKYFPRGSLIQKKRYLLFESDQKIQFVNTENTDQLFYPDIINALVIKEPKRLIKKSSDGEEKEYDFPEGTMFIRDYSKYLHRIFGDDFNLYISKKDFKSLTEGKNRLLEIEDPGSMFEKLSEPDKKNLSIIFSEHEKGECRNRISFLNSCNYDYRNRLFHSFLDKKKYPGTRFHIEVNKNGLFLMDNQDPKQVALILEFLAKGRSFDATTQDGQDGFKAVQFN